MTLPIDRTLPEERTALDTALLMAKYPNQAQKNYKPEQRAEILKLAEAEVDRLRECAASLDGLEVAKNQAYSERNQLVALLSKLFPASLERHNEADKEWEDDWRWIVFIDFGMRGTEYGQKVPGVLSWHIHDSELSRFDHLPRQKGVHTWDGHTTMEKYVRLADVPNGYAEVNITPTVPYPMT